MSKRKPYMHKHFMSMMRINPSADAEGRHSEGKKPYSYKRATYKQMEDLDFKDLARLKGAADPCSGHRDLSGGFTPLSLNCGDGVQEIKFEVSSDFVTPVIVADEDGLSFTDRPIDKNTIQEIGTGNTLMTFDPDAFSGDGIEIICIDVVDATCGGKSTFCMFLIGCDECVDVDCDLPTVTGSDNIAISSSAQYTFNDAQGDVEWGISGGGGATIDSDGLVTTDADACGTATVTATDSCCGEFTKEILLDYPAGVNSEWSNISSDTGGITFGGFCTDLADLCNNAHGGNTNQDCVEGTLRYRGSSRCMFSICLAECADRIYGPDVPGCWTNPCGGGTQYVNQLWIDEWICSP